VRLKVLGAYGSEGKGQRPSAFLVDDTILIDAGTVGGALTVAEQIAIDHAVLSHGHLDHVAGLAYLTDTLAMTAPDRPVTCWSIAPVIEALSEHEFNDRLWPNFRNIPSPAEPVLALRVVTEEVETRVGHVSVTPVPVDHTVPAAGYIVHDGSAGFVYTGVRGLKALVVETAFPNRLAPLAKASGHLTPDMLRQEIEKMPDLPVWIFHIKPQLYEETVAELEQIDPTRIHILEQGKTYNL